MAEVTNRGPYLADSTLKTRPSFNRFMETDVNQGGTAVDQIEENRRARQMKFPSLCGKKDVDSMKEPQNPTDIAFKKWNDEGDYRSPAPYRSCDNIIDPTCGFVSACGDEDRHTGHTRIASMVQLNHTPQSYNPRELHSIRHTKSGPPDTYRLTENDPGTSYIWNSRLVPDAKLRANLGGWTSDRDPRLEKETAPVDESKAIRDKLSLKYMYTSYTQSAYGEVPWDNKSPPRKWAPVSTLERKPDVVSQRYTRPRYEPAAQEWQRLGRSWDWFQTRDGHYKKNAPIPGIVFCSAVPRTNQIPNYGGCSGGENIADIDDVNVPFEPFTTKRNPQPQPTDTSHRPDIPGYKGCTRFMSSTVAAHSGLPDPEPDVHRAINSYSANNSAYKRDSQMSKMVTTVPPCNPFNKIDSTALAVN